MHAPYYVVIMIPLLQSQGMDVSSNFCLPHKLGITSAWIHCKKRMVVFNVISVSPKLILSLGILSSRKLILEAHCVCMLLLMYSIIPSNPSLSGSVFENKHLSVFPISQVITTQLCWNCENPKWWQNKYHAFAVMYIHYHCNVYYSETVVKSII